VESGISIWVFCMVSLMHAIGSFSFRRIGRSLSDMHSFRMRYSTATPSDQSLDRGGKGDQYKLTPLRTFLHRIPEVLPPSLRDWAAERFLRRVGAPGPAAEHAFQYLLSAAKAKEHHKVGHLAVATDAKGADNFYQRQYRQYFNAKMGAFAMTAKMALIGSGGLPSGRLWGRRRPVYASMLEETAGALPIIVINRETAAVPFLLPQPSNRTDYIAVGRWLTGHGSMPLLYRNLVAGDEVRCAERGVRARIRTADGALLEVVDAVTNSRKLAVLALHPHDPDAMALHITLFDTQVLTPKFLGQDYGLECAALDPWRRAASAKDRLLVFCVGGTEEIFTQCSQNLFVKKPHPGVAQRPQAILPNAWRPGLALEPFLGTQFEILQVTVSISGLPGVSPRNGDQGKAAFVGRRGAKTFVLIPYFPGNEVHGHAAKLWSNAYGELVIWDDHRALSAVTISGPARVVMHQTVEKDFPSIAAKIAMRRKRNGAAAPNPEYWFLQEVAELVQQSEPLAASLLDPSRPTCSIQAGGLAHHGKKPAYFGADTLPPYDRSWQHEREAAGRPTDPTGEGHSQWVDAVAPALAARHAHLDHLCA
jgi:hypothetical protein